MFQRVLLVLVVTAGCESGLGKAEIDRTKQSIRSELSKIEGVTVEDVALVKESATRLTGFAKIRIGKEIVTIDCEATHYPETPGDENVLWKCPAVDSLKGKSEDTTYQDEARSAVAKMEGFTKTMCGCRTKECADMVNEDMTRWGTEMARNHRAPKEARPDPVLAQKSADIMTRYTECLTKLMMR